MPEDINLPNLVSHLAVNLDGLNGTIADAQRQGSSIGAALGAGVQRELRDLVSHLPEIEIDGNSTDLDRDLARVRREMDELATQRIGVDISIEDALRRIGELQPHLDRLSDQHPNINVQAATRGASRQLDELLAAAHRVDGTDVEIDVHVDEDQINRAHGLLGKLTAGLGSLGGIGASIGMAAAKIGAIVPAASSVVTTLASVAPAAGVAVTGLAAMQLASGAVKLAAVGMGDALSAALDPSKAKEYNEALAKLSPEARGFAQAVHGMSPELRDLQQTVQDRVFEGWGETLQWTAKSVLPTLRGGLVSAGESLNAMGLGVMYAAKNLQSSGALGQAVSSAGVGLRNLSGIPGVVVTSLGQIAAAAGPSFERLTAGAGEAAAKIGDKLTKAFKSGAMQKAIEHAIDLIKQLAEIGGNVVTIIGNVFSAMPPGGGGMVSVLQDVSAALASITASPEVQSGLRSIFETMGVIGKTVAPLLAQALSAVAPVFTALGPPVQTLVTALGDGLSPVIDALGPVLTAAAEAFGSLITAISPILPVLGQLIADFLPVLTPLFDALRQIFDALAPSISVIADILGQTLGPILQALPEFIQPLLDAFVEMAQKEGPLLADLLTQLAPSFADLAKAFADVMVQLGPLLPQLLLLGTQLFEKIAPYLPGLIEEFARLANMFTGVLVFTLQNIVIPALQLLNDLLEGDTPKATAATGKAIQGLERIMSTAWDVMVSYVKRKIDEALSAIAALPGRAGSALSGLAGSLASKATQAGSSLLSAVRSKLDSAVSTIRGLPSRAAGALGGLGGVLRGAGASLISGFISGIQSQIGSVRSTLQGLTSKLTDWKGPKRKDAKILTPAGRLLIEGLIKGITGSTAKLRTTLQSITKALPANVRSGYGKVLAKAVRELDRVATARDAVVKKLEASQKKLDDLVKARSKAASDITSGILSEANITSGHSDVNSVSAITVELQQAVKATKEFDANVTKLKKAGLRSDLLQQIADAGVEGGAATATALARATPAELKRINDLQSQLATSAKKTGDTVGDALYGAGIRAAQGLVAGLKSQETAIEKQMTKIAKGMLTTTKKVHKTHSPSRAFAEIAHMDMEGLRVGTLARAHRVIGAVSDVAHRSLAAASGVGGAITAAIPTGGQIGAVYAGAGASGGGDNHFHMYGGDATPGGILRALSWQGLVGRP